ncbi:MAG: acyl--CoA ligase, partial [Aquisalinus sp.]|nr:acyl--CoA ligase [Aquisalinus sp.]
GLNVFASDLEAVLSEHPDVLDCAVVAAASERWGETPVAFAVLSGKAAASPQDLLEWVNAQLSKHQRLAEIIPSDELPRNMMGKLMKQTLREKLRQQRA